jgi:cellulose biosynthesis protein BcsQ
VAPSFGKPVLEYEPTSRGAAAYADLAQEVLQRGIFRLPTASSGGHHP